MKHSGIWLLILPLLLNVNDATEVVAYWGQNSGGSQQRLSKYCDTDSVDVIVLTYMSSFPSFQLDFADLCTQTFDTGLLNCPEIGEDITYCQGRGKKVLLSLGGSGNNYGFTSDSNTQQFAYDLWNQFGGGQHYQRPFGEAIFDGFDFQIENGSQDGYMSAIGFLRNYINTAVQLSMNPLVRKKYYISASPYCPYPNSLMGDILTSNTFFEYVFVKFYDNSCSLGNAFNWESWKEYADNEAFNTNTKLFLGLPASPDVSPDYADLEIVKEHLRQIQCDDNFGGVALWDASAAWSNLDSSGVNYAEQIKNALNDTGNCASSSIEYSLTSLQSSSSSEGSFITSDDEFTPSESLESLISSSTSMDVLLHSSKLLNTESYESSDEVKASFLSSQSFASAENNSTSLLLSSEEKPSSSKSDLTILSELESTSLISYETTILFEGHGIDGKPHFNLTIPGMFTPSSVQLNSQGDFSWNPSITVLVNQSPVLESYYSPASFNTENIFLTFAERLLKSSTATILIRGDIQKNGEYEALAYIEFDNTQGQLINKREQTTSTLTATATVTDFSTSTYFLGFNSSLKLTSSYKTSSIAYSTSSLSLKDESILQTSKVESTYTTWYSGSSKTASTTTYAVTTCRNNRCLTFTTSRELATTAISKMGGNQVSSLSNGPCDNCEQAQTTRIVTEISCEDMVCTTSEYTTVYQPHKSSIEQLANSKGSQETGSTILASATKTHITSGDFSRIPNVFATSTSQANSFSIPLLEGSASVRSIILMVTMLAINFVFLLLQ